MYPKFLHLKKILFLTTLKIKKQNFLTYAEQCRNIVGANKVTVLAVDFIFLLPQPDWDWFDRDAATESLALN